MNCDLYQNPYKTKCSGSISPDGEVSVCWRHLAANRDWWMEQANKLALQIAKAPSAQSLPQSVEGK